MPLERLGLQKTSLIDYPGEVASVVFTAGCNLRCPYCHNPELINGTIPDDFLPVSDVLKHIFKRKNVLGGICITGGEPLLHDELSDFIKEIKKSGLKVKLDTNGLLPEKIETVHPDYVALDIKTSPSRYHMLGFSEAGCTAPVQNTIEYLKRSGIPHGYRITLVPGIFGKEDAEQIAAMLSEGDCITVSQFRNAVTLSSRYREIEPYTKTAALQLLSPLQEKKIAVKLSGFN